MGKMVIGAIVLIALFPGACAGAFVYPLFSPPASIVAEVTIDDAHTICDVSVELTSHAYVGWKWLPHWRFRKVPRPIPELAREGIDIRKEGGQSVMHFAADSYVEDGVWKKQLGVYDATSDDTPNYGVNLRSLDAAQAAGEPLELQIMRLGFARKSANGVMESVPESRVNTIKDHALTPNLGDQLAECARLLR